ncbi:MAG: hypothetical protein PVG07_15275, partial [Acidobacteriota bacterium]
MNRLRTLTSLAALVAMLLAGCGAGDSERRSRPVGSAVWVDPRVATVSPAAARSLRTAGVDEVFLAAADLAAGAEGFTVETWARELPGAVPRRTPTTLVVLGEWPPPIDLDAARTAETLDRSLAGLREASEDAGLLPVGIHLHLVPHAAHAPAGAEDPRLELLAELVLQVRAGLPEDLFLSVSLVREWLGAPGAEAVAGSADFLVPFLYGQPPGALDRAEDWDPERTEEDLARAEALGADYLLGLRTIGSASRLDASGDVIDATTRASLAEMAGNRALRRNLGDAFGGVGRLAYAFQAQRRTRVGAWDVAPGEAVRVVRTAPALLYDLRRRAREAASERLLGLLFHRLPDPAEEALSPGAEGLATVFGDEPPAPDIHARLVIRSLRGQTAVLGVSLQNRSSLSTDLALGDGNYLSVRTEGAVVERVDPGRFARYSLWRDDQEVRPGIGWREPDQVRLYTPVVTGDATI